MNRRYRDLRAATMRRLGRMRWPFKVSLVEERGLRARTGKWADAKGIFHVTLTMDHNVRLTAPTLLAETVFWHEVRHVTMLHGFQSFVLWLLSAGVIAWWALSDPWLLLAAPFLYGARIVMRAAHEIDADRHAMERLGLDRFAAGIVYCTQKPRRGPLGWIDRFVYGATWQARLRRLGVQFREPEPLSPKKALLKARRLKRAQEASR